jgi:BirA family transcriptional regulator, biotin operon repressor / biotin---[acetyl-CoA-carboxylase] ligase
MSSDAMSSDWDVRRFGEIDSTNRYLLEQARNGAPARVVAVAGHQTAGRGRLDRRWESPPGTNLLVSFLLRPRCEPSELHLGTAAVALAAADACRVVAGVDAPLKWPNDLLVGGSKVAGVLAETDFGSGPPAALVVGLGLNVRWPGPPGAGGTSLEEAHGSALDPEALLVGVLDALSPRVDLLDDAAGRVELAEEQRRRCATLGTTVRVRLAAEEVIGTAREIDDAGQLVVDTAGGPRTVAAGDVVHLRPESGGSAAGQ